MTSLAREVEALSSTPDEDDDLFAELDAIIAESTAKSAAESSLKAKQKRLAQLTRQGKEGPERDSILAEVRRLEEAIVWRSVSATALFWTQDCAWCKRTTRFFQGWMTEQHHRTDPTGRRLIRGKPIEQLPERIEEHQMGTVPFCGHCYQLHIAEPAHTTVKEQSLCLATSVLQPIEYHRPSSLPSAISSAGVLQQPASSIAATSSTTAATAES
jgi:hypothetical protein